MKSVVFEFRIPDVLTIRVTGSNEGRYARYCNRIGVSKTDAKADVVYTSSMAGKWTLENDEGTELTRGIKGRPVFYEAVYQVRCSFDPKAKVSEASVFHEMSSIADEFYYENDLLDGRLDFVNAPGRFTFEVDYVSHGKPQRLKLAWWVVSEKIDVVSDAKTIKEVIEKENKGFVYAFLSQTKDRAGISSRRSGREDEWLDIFRQFVDPYILAVKWIVQSPHLRYQPQTQFERADRIRRWTPQLSNRYQAMNSDMKERSLFRVERIEPKIDTLENRFVLFTLKKISGKLGMLERLCRDAKGVAETYADRVHSWKKELCRLRAKPFFRSIGSFTGLKQESLVLQRKRGYSKILETWLALQHAIDVTRQGIDAGNRPIWKLYEFWCYLAIRDYIKNVKMEGGGARYVIDEAQSGLGSLLKIADVFEDPDLGCDSKAGVARAKGDKKCEYVFSDTVAGRTIRLTYQKSYSNEIEADTDNRSMAHIVEQIPDIVMTTTENSGEKNSYTYLFDAKYQIMPLPSVEDPQTDAAPYRTINEMHRYRDAILYRRQKAGGDDKGKLTHEVIGAYVLYPGRPDKSFNYKRFIEEENIGAIPLLPGTDGTKVLYEFLDYVLKHQDAHAHLGTAIPTRGTSVVVASSESDYLATEVVYGTYRNSGGFDQLDWIKEKRVYNMPIDKAEEIGIVDEASAKAKSMLFLVSSRKEKPSIFRIKRGSASKIKQSDLVSMHGYSPRNPEPEKEYWLWELEIE